jgi:hypothetical protein
MICTTGSLPAPVLNWILIGAVSELPCAFQSLNAFWAAALS